MKKPPMIDLLALGFYALGYASIRWLRKRLDGERLNGLKLMAYVVINGFFVVPYLDIAYNDTFLFMGHRPDLVESHPVVGWGALIMAIVHSGTYPTRDGFRFSSLFRKKSRA